jgi:hypothetical protein
MHTQMNNNGLTWKLSSVFRKNAVPKSDCQVYYISIEP